MVEFKDIQKSVSLKNPEPDVNLSNPWHDDEMNRERMAEALTNLLINQKESFIISLDGGWGTGKTFFLKRWNQQLQNDGFQSIYFNAWEDDFYDDPFVAIIGQISEQLEENKIPERDKLMNAAKSLVFSLSSDLTGVNTKEIVAKLSNQAIEQYSCQRKNKVKFKELLKQTSQELTKKSNTPLVFIVDELDRCRPIFAIELLERIKHVFDVPNVVFVLGINRIQLEKSIKSVYGDIDANVYLRRFFDMDFSLPESDLAQFCDFMVKKYGLKNHFTGLSRIASSDVHMKDFQSFHKSFRALCKGFRLSLRDIDYCIRLVAFVCKNIQQGYYMYSHLVVVLLVLRLKNPILYKDFIGEKLIASKVIDYLRSEFVHEGDEDSFIQGNFLFIEMELYLTDSTDINTNIALQQLKRKLNAETLIAEEYLSKTILKAPKEVIRKMVSMMEQSPTRRHNYGPDRKTLKYISGLIELVEI